MLHLKKITKNKQNGTEMVKLEDVAIAVTETELGPDNNSEHRRRPSELVKRKSENNSAFRGYGRLHDWDQSSQHIPGETCADRYRLENVKRSSISPDYEYKFEDDINTVQRQSIAAETSTSNKKQSEN